jgi:CxxC motif-containing protein (DUF1111 family)
VIHVSAVADEYKETFNLLDRDLPISSQLSLQQLNPGPQALMIPRRVVLAQRNTPALFGTGLIDQIPEHVIIANMRDKIALHMAVGRILRLPNGGLGRFGWKAQTSSLSEFVQAACANELGLSNPNHPQPTPLRRPEYKKVGFDLTQEQCDQMTAFIASLPRPIERTPTDANERTDAAQGKVLFRRMGCADCHTPSLGSVKGIYSDLLLHRMGSELASGGVYYDFGTPSNGPQADEWRTTPLWGVADSAPYMHDGRAATLDDAIRMHGSYAHRYLSLPRDDQRRLITFLKTLRAPAKE